MAQPHKGDRKQIQANIDPRVKAELAWRAKHLGLYLSDYIALMAAEALGRPDLAGVVEQAALSPTPEMPILMVDPTDTFISPRFHRPVYDLISTQAAIGGVPRGYIVDELCAQHVGGHVHHHSTEQGDLLTSA